MYSCSAGHCGEDQSTPGFPLTDTRFPSNKRVHAPCPPRTHPTSLKRNTWIPLCLSRSKQNVRKHGARTEHVRSTYGARAEHVGKNHETRTPPLLKIRGYNIKTLRIVESLHFVVFSNVLRTCSVRAPCFRAFCLLRDKHRGLYAA